MSVTTMRRDRTNIDHYDDRVDLACAFRWAVKYNLHEAVANHFSLAVNEDGSRFLMNPNQRHFSRIRASDLLLIDVNDPPAMEDDDAPDPTAWGLHGAVHRHCPHARCVMHTHATHATVLASLADSRLPAIDQNTAMFHDRVVIDEDYGGLAFEEEGERCAGMLSDPKKKVMIMGNHGVLVIGSSAADAFNRL
ncbi:MAG: class II aldolase/adducin family protein, partial [Parvularculales bacterium]